MLQDLIVKAMGVESFPEAKKALAAARRKRVSASIETMLDRAAMRELKAAKARAKTAEKRDRMIALAALAQAVISAREAKQRALARKDDARRKIIIGGTIITAILDNAPGGPALLEGLRARLGEVGWRSVEPIFNPSEDEKFLAEFLQGKPPDVAALAAIGEAGKSQLVKVYHETEAKIEKALDLAQTWNGVDQRQQRAADARRKITVGGAVIAAIREKDATAPALLQLLNNRIGSTRDRETVRAILPIGEFRPVGRP